MSADDKYTYPGSNGVLKNLLGIRDRHRLDEAMNDYASAAWAALIQDLPESPDFDYLCHIHRTMFEDLLPWAGELRDVDVEAGGTGVVYARPHFLGNGIEDLFGQLRSEDYLAGVPESTEFAGLLADRWGYLTLIHPFRDGNTRSQSLFVSQLARRAGHPISWSRVDVDQLRDLRLAAMSGQEPRLARYLDTLMGSSGPNETHSHVLGGRTGPTSGVATTRGRVGLGTADGGQFTPRYRPEAPPSVGDSLMRETDGDQPDD